MINRKLLGLSVAVIAVVILVIGWLLVHPTKKNMYFVSPAAKTNDNKFSFDNYTDVLKTYVDDQGMVSYRQLSNHREKLDNFAIASASLDQNLYEKWNEQEKIAFWINLYNGLTLEAIINNYPIKPSITGVLLYPKNSIRQIPGVWESLQFDVMGRKMTLEKVEHEVLRKQFNEPRIHMALVCAAISCPPLRNEAYLGEKLNEQLDDQTRKFLSNQQKFRIDRDNNKVYLSSIFKWFGEDFIKLYKTNDKFSDHSNAERAVLAFISHYLDPNDRDYLEKGKYSIEYLTYDWSLNEHK